MNRKFAASLLAIALAAAGAAHAAPAAQYSIDSEGAGVSQLYPSTAAQAQFQGKSIEQAQQEVRAEQARHPAASFASDSESASLATLYPAAEAAPAFESHLTRAQVRQDYQAARAAGELRNSDTGLTDRELFPQQYAAGRTARVQ